MATQNNPLRGCALEFHILQSFPVTCLNRDDVGAPKSAIVGGVQRARVSSQCWKRAVRLALRDLGVRCGIRTKNLERLLQAACEEKGATPEQAAACAAPIASALAKDTLLFISNTEIGKLADYAKENNFTLQTESKAKKGKKKDDALSDDANVAGGSLPKAEVTRIAKILSYRAADGLDIALFGRMVAMDASVNVHAAAAFSHAISTHKSTNEVEFFTALDDAPDPDKDDAGSAHMGTLEYNSATYYRYISLDLGQLWENLGGEDIEKSVSAFINALYIAVPAARQNTQSGACLWDYARVLLRKGPRMQVSFDEPVRAKGSGWLAPSIEALNAALTENERACDSLYGKQAEFTFGKGAMSIDELRKGVQTALAQLLAAQGQA